MIHEQFMEVRNRSRVEKGFTRSESVDQWACSAGIWGLMWSIALFAIPTLSPRVSRQLYGFEISGVMAHPGSGTAFGVESRLRAV